MLMDALTRVIEAYMYTSAGGIDEILVDTCGDIDDLPSVLWELSDIDACNDSTSAQSW